MTKISESDLITINNNIFTSKGWNKVDQVNIASNC